MLEFLIEEIFVELGGTIFQQITSIPMGTSCAPLLATLFLDSYEVECIRKIIKDKTFHQTSILPINFPQIAIYQPFLCMEFKFHNSYATFVLAVFVFKLFDVAVF
jgi:hypothetical protein